MNDLTKEIPELASTQEEADTKLILHANYHLMSSSSSDVTIFSPSGDTDIIVLAVSLLKEYKSRVSIMDGPWKRETTYSA